MKKYETEARENWGGTEAYREYVENTQNYTKEKWDEASSGLMAIFAEFSVLKDNGVSADSEESQALAMKLQKYISENYYTCTLEILAGLGQMYICDERFKKNIDKNGTGTAEYAASAIVAYTKRMKK